MVSKSRAQHEIDHGKKLSESGAEDVWGWSTPSGQVRFHRRANWIIRSAGLRPGVNVLEVGCGTGNFTEPFSATGANLLALDISEELLARAHERNLPDTVQFICHAFETLEMQGQFDAVVGSSVLHHLDISPALSTIFNLLKPGGVIAFAEPNMLNPQIFIQKNIQFIKQRVGDSPDETAFFRGQLVDLLSKAGFEKINVIPLDWLHPAVPKAAIGFTRKCELVLEKLPIIREFAGSLYINAYRPGTL